MFQSKPQSLDVRSEVFDFRVAASQARKNHGGHPFDLLPDMGPPSDFRGSWGRCVQLPSDWNVRHRFCKASN